MRYHAPCPNTSHQPKPRYGSLRPTPAVTSPSPATDIQRALSAGASLAYHFDPGTKTYFVEAVTASGRP